MKAQQTYSTRLTLAFAVALVATLLSTTLWAAGGDEKPGSPSPPVSGSDSRSPFYVRYASGRRAAVQQAIKNAGGRIIHRLPSVNTDAALLPEAAVQAVSSRAGVDFIEPIPEHRLAGQAPPYNIDQYQAREIWDSDRDGVIDTKAPDGSKVKLCIIDTGLYAAHDDFAGVAIAGVSQISGEGWFEDGHGHGTHVAGTANAVHNDIGVVGSMPGGAELFIVKAFSNSGAWTSESSLGAAAVACRDAGANVISMSLGGGYSSTEEAMFQDLYDNYGILSIAAAGNAGDETQSFPASYDSVVSVAAIDSSESVASFSQHPTSSYDPDNPPPNTEWDVVEFSGGGVNVLSTWPGPPHENVPLHEVSVSGSAYQGKHVQGSGLGEAEGPLIDGGFCDSVGSWSGSIVLCERGINSFANKVNNVRDGGGLGAIIYNDRSGDLLASCGGNCSTPLIPAIGLTQADGQDLASTALGDNASLSADDGSGCADCTGGYNAISGTSMATPGVAAGVALTWDACGGPAGLTNKQVRQLLRDSSKDLSGTHPTTGVTYGSGWDRVTGWGLVQLHDAQELGNQLYGSTCPITLDVSPSVVNVCGADNDSAQTTVVLNDALQGSVTMSATGVPAGAAAGFSPNPVEHPTKETGLTLSGLSGVASGTYEIGAVATDDSDSTNTATGHLVLDLDAAAPGQTALQSPADGSGGVFLRPTLSWGANSEANGYLVEIATDSGFDTIVHSAAVSGTSYDVPVILNPYTTYYWRVTATNHCGSGTVSAPSSFTTSSKLMACSEPGVAIPDNATAGVGDSISISGSESIVDLNLYLRGAHTWVGDLSFDLTHPDGTTKAVLVDQPGVPVSEYGCGVDNFDLWLDDEGADGPVEDMCPSSAPALFGRATPNDPLSAFDGLGSAGDWTLNASDNVSNDTGSLVEWCLEITYDPPGPYTLTYTAGPNGSIIGASPQTVDHGDDGSSVEAVPDTGYHFVEWSDGGRSNPRVDTGVTSDITVEAQFSVNVYSVTGTVDSGSGSVSPADQSVNHGDAAALTVEPDAGWHTETVSGCGGSLSGTTYTTGEITGDCTVTASFAINRYTVTFVDFEGTVLKTETVDHGSAAIAPADPTRDGYSFTGWDKPFDNVTSDLTVTAEYEINRYTVIFVDYDGTVLKTETVDHSSAATAPADPTRYGYSFTGWDKTFDSVTSDLTVTAKYAPLEDVIFSDSFGS